MSDFVEWEPGYTVFCVLCQHESGGGDPPGPWIRHRPGHRRRIPIYDAHYWIPKAPRWRALGYLEYIAL